MHKPGLLLVFLSFTACGSDEGGDGGDDVTCELPILLDDDFDDGDLAAGGTNGGFVLSGNGIGGNDSVDESGGRAVISVDGVGAGGEPNTGAHSLSSFDAISTSPFTVRWEIASADAGVWNGIVLYLSRENDFYEGAPGLVIRLTGDPADYFSTYEAGLAAEGPFYEFESQPYDSTTLADGFVATLEITPVEWAYRIDGIMEDGSQHSASGDMVVGHWGSDVIDADTHVGAALQAENADTEPRVMEVERITVLEGLCPEGAEPTLP